MRLGEFTFHCCAQSLPCITSLFPKGKWKKGKITLLTLITYSLEGKFSDPGFTVKQHPGKIIDRIISLTINDTMWHCVGQIFQVNENLCAQLRANINDENIMIVLPF